MDRPADASKVDLVESYRQLAEIYHELLAYEALERLLDRVGDSIARLVACSSLLIAEVDHRGLRLVPLVVRGEWPDDVMDLRIRLGEGLIGWAAANGKAVCANAAHRDPRAGHVVGTPIGDPEAIISVPFVSNGMVLGAMSVYREGEGLAFSSAEFELAQRFGDAATLALVNATTRTELHRLAHTDDLTGLRNRRGFFADASAALAEIDSRPVALVMLDLDNFKAVNDGHGHAVGDALLRHCARQIAATADAEATIGRLGGDEFAVLVRGDDVNARGLATRLQQALEASPFLAASGAITASASVGFTASDDARITLDELVANADARMYDDKRDRGGRHLAVTGSRAARFAH